MLELFIRYAHFLGMLLLASSLVAEHLLLTKTMTGIALRKVMIVDGIYGVSAVVVLTAGLMLWLGVGKPAVFYTSNFLFHIKFTLFILMALISIYPTVFFIRNRKERSKKIEIPKLIFWAIRMELMLLALIPLFAVFIARGIGQG